MDINAPSPLDAITFAGGTRDRADHLRGNAELMAQMLKAPEARVLPLWRGKPLFAMTEDGPVLGWLPSGSAALDAAEEPPIFMGLEDGAGRFAVDISAWTDPEFPDGPPPVFMDQTRQSHPDLPEAMKFVDLRNIMAELTTQDAADAATARGMFEWHRSHRFCAKCGQPSVLGGAGWRRRCYACGGMHFPRTDPVVIQLITRGDKVLLGRSPAWPPGFWSLLAGFMEPGETLEEAVRRETYEETSIRVGRVRYVVSQPWPFPSSLMLACAGEALSEEITIDPVELEAARWVSRAELLDSMENPRPDFVAARKGAVAHAVLQAWAYGWIEGV
jgi:NAD+ diphosphatase